MGTANENQQKSNYRGKHLIIMWEEAGKRTNIMESQDWFVLEGTSKIVQFQLPATGRDTFH